MPESIIRIPDHSAELAAIRSELQDLKALVQALSSQPDSPYMDTREAMAYLRIKSAATFRKRLRAAGVSAVKTQGGKLIYLKTEIERI